MATNPLQNFDPYAAIRSLDLKPFALPAQAGEEGRANRLRSLAYKDYMTPTDEALAALGAGGFQTKYGSYVVPLGDGRYEATFQQPGAHKYDTLQAIYAQDPTTGKYALQADPTASRQTSSTEQLRDFVEYAGPRVGLAMAGAYGLDAALGAGLASSGGGLSGMDLAADAAFGSGNNILSAGAGLGGSSIPLTAAEMGVGQFPAGMEGFNFMPASATAEGAAGSAAGGYGGLTGGGLLTGNAGATLGDGLAGFGGLGEAGGAMAALSGGGGGGVGNFLSSLGSTNSLANLAQGAIGLYGQNKAIGAMQDATNSANEFNRYAFDTIRADNKPLVDMRNSVLPQIQSLLANPGSVMNDPGNQFQFAQGQKALANGAASRGMTYSGQQGKRLQEYGQDFASTKLDDSLRRLQSVAGLGQVGNNSNNAATANFGANASNNALNMGNARGSAYGNMANIGGNALAGIFNPWQWDQVNGRGG